MAQRKALAGLVLLVCGLLLVGVAFATGDYGLAWWSIGSGGGRAAAGSYALDATLGQAVVGSSGSASGLLHAGYWPGAVAQPATATPSPTATPTGTTAPTSTATLTPTSTTVSTSTTTPTVTSTVEPATATPTATRTGVPATPSSTPTATSTVELPPPTPVVVGPWQSWTNGNYVNALAVDGDYVWAGTAGGVVRWDLTTGSFTRHLAPHGLPDNYVSAVEVDDAGRLWFGLGTWNGGVAVYDAGTWTTFTQRDGLDTGWVNDVIIDGDGRKWVGTARGVSVLNDNGTPHDKGDDTWTTFREADGLADDSVSSIGVDEAGHKWIGTWSNGVSVLDDAGTPHDKSDDAWTSFTTADGLADDAVYAVTVDAAGRKWFGTSGGVSVLDDNGTPHNKADDTWTSFTTADGLADDTVYAITVDAAGRKWFGASGGVSVLDDAGTPHDKADDTWTTFTTADGLADSVRAVAVGAANQQGLAIDAAGRKWIATGWSGVRMLDDAGTPFDPSDDVWMTFTRAEGLVEDRAQTVAVSVGGVVWVGTDGGLGRMAGGAQRRLYLPLLARNFGSR